MFSLSYFLQKHSRASHRHRAEIYVGELDERIQEVVSFFESRLLNRRSRNSGIDQNLFKSPIVYSIEILMIDMFTECVHSRRSDARRLGRVRHVL